MRLMAAAAQRPALWHQLQGVLHQWSRHVPGEVQSLAEWTQTESPPDELVSVVRDTFLASVDARIQNIYLRSPESQHVSSVDEVLARLAGDIDEVRAEVNAWDWHWLAGWLEPNGSGALTSLLGRLANFAFPMTRVNFRFTYHCNIACRHCYNRSGPTRRTEQIPLDVMLDVIDELEAVGIRSVNLTGGEPLLYPENVHRLVMAARARNVSQVSIYTNGFWGQSFDGALDVLMQLSAAGFMQSDTDYMKVSAGVYHQEFIPFDRVINIAQAYFRLYARPLLVDFEALAGTTDGAAWASQRLAERHASHTAVVTVRSVSPVGRGRDIVIPADPAPNRPCTIINQLTFDPDGTVRPCCGLNDQNHGIITGKAGTDSLKVLAKRMQNDPVLHFLSKRPLRDILTLLPVQGEPAFGGACDMCQRTVGQITDKAKLQSTLRTRQNWYPFWFQAGRDERSIEVIPATI